MKERRGDEEKAKEIGRVTDDREAVVKSNFDTASEFCSVLLRTTHSLIYLIKGENGNAMAIMEEYCISRWLCERIFRQDMMEHS